MRHSLLLLLVACGGSSSNGGDAGTVDAFDCTCEVAPPSVCLDGSTLESSQAPGTCVNNTCEYATTTTPCPFGCENGECQPQTCTPSCPSATCVDDGCGGTCGPCTSGTTFPGVTATSLGIADDLLVAPDGLHVATSRALEPLPANCGFNPPRVGTLDVRTIPAGGGTITTRTIGTDVPLWATQFTSTGLLVYFDKVNPCLGRGEMWVAKADGSQTKRILAETAVGVQVVGSTAFYAVPDPNDPDKSTFDGFLYAVKLPDGQPIKLADIRYNSTYGIAPSGTAVWVNYSRDLRDLRIVRLDGTSTQLHSTTETYADYPQWSPDGKKLAFPLFNGTGSPSLHVIDADGTGRTMLDDACNCADFDAMAWSHDSVRVAWLQRPPTFGLDAQVHSFAGGADVILTGVVSPTTGGQVFRMTFSNDNARLYAAAGSDQNGWKLMSGNVAQAGAMTALVSTLQADGSRFSRSWLESPNGSVIAVNSTDSSTKVITLGGAAQSVAGIPFEQAQLEPVAANPRWIIQKGSTAAAIYPTNGSGTGTALPGFQWTNDLSSWAFSRHVPFVYGWSGSTVLYPSAVTGSFFGTVSQDLMAQSPTTNGRLGTGVKHYALGAQRVYFTTTQDGFFYVPSP
jgi:hypothetical protein